MFTVRGQITLVGKVMSDYSMDFDTHAEALKHSIALQADNQRMLIWIEYTDRTYSNIVPTDWVSRSIMTH